MTTITEERRSLVEEMTRTVPVTFPERPVQMDPTAYGLGQPVRPVLIHSARTTVDDSDLSGKVRLARPSNTHDRGWYVAGYGYYYGTELNPEPVTDHHYRQIESPSCLLRFDDGIWNIVGGPNGEPWVMGDNDSLLDAPQFYYEVEYTAPGTADQPAAEQATTTDAPPPAEMTQWARAIEHAHVKVEPDGTVAMSLSPAWEDGKMYVGVRRTGRTDTLAYALKQAGREAPVYMGYWHYGWGLFEHTSSGEIPTDYVWAEAADPNEPTRARDTTQARRLEALTQQEAELTKEFKALNRALSEMANKHGWCSEYEAVMERIGMKGRGWEFRGIVRDVRVGVTAIWANMSEEKREELRTVLGADGQWDIGFIKSVPELEITVTARDRNYIRDYINIQAMRQAVFDTDPEGFRAFGIESAETLRVDAYDAGNTDWVELDDDGNPLVVEAPAETDVPLAD